MKRIIYIMIILLSICVSVSAADIYDSVLTKDIESKIDESFDILNENSTININALELIDKFNKGDFDVDSNGFITKLKYSFIDAIKDNIKSLLRILAVILLTSVISKINIGIGDKNPSRIASVSVVLIIIIETFLGISNTAIKVIDTLTVFINSLIPVLLTLIATGGKIITAKLLNPIILAASSVATMVIKSLIIPLSVVSLSLMLTYSATEKENVLFFSKQISSLIKWLIGLMLTIYMGIVSLGSTVSVNIDGTVLKTAKFAVGSFVPYVGNMLSDSVELVLNGAEVVKNSVGIVGLIGIIGIISLPCIFLIVKVLMFKLIYILAIPVSEKIIVTALEGVSDCVSLLLGMVLVVAVMYILSITVIIHIGGA